MGLWPYLVGEVMSESESSLRFKVRNAYREDGRLDTYKEYPADSIERSICISEAQKIRFEDEFEAIENGN